MDPAHTGRTARGFQTWLGDQDSNLDSRSQSPLFCR